MQTATSLNLRNPILVKPTVAIESARPIQGEPGAVYARALEQHEILRKTLGFFGIEATVVDAGGEDACEPAVINAGVAFEDGVYLMRPTSMERRAQVERVRSELDRLQARVIGEIPAPGLLDGSDVLLAGQTAFVGVGARGNSVGVEAFTSAARDRGLTVVEIPLPRHAPPLRAIATAVAHDTVVIASEFLRADRFATFNAIELDRGEATAAGVLTLGERHVIANVRYRTALARMRKAGLTVEGIDLYDFEKVGMTPSMLALGTTRA